VPRTPGFDALGFEFHVTADDASLIDRLSWLFRGLTTRSAAKHEYLLSARGGASDVPKYDVLLDGSRVNRATGGHDVASVLVHDVTARALAGTDHLVLHAGGVVHDGAAVALPGVTATGKSTLVAGLVRAGMAYLTDEAVAIDRSSLLGEPYAKPISIDAGAWALFPDLRTVGVLPEPPDARSPTVEWQVAPDDLRLDCVASAAPIERVLFPRYVADIDMRLERIGRGAALVEATKHTFSFGERARANLDVLAEVIRGADCFTLSVGDLEVAVAAVLDLVGARGAGIDR
jgi:hypothetical protein